MRLVVALGGNALLKRGEAMDVATQRANVAVAARAVADLAADNEIIVTHGNGPQVGLLALQGEVYGEVPPYPLDVLGAETEGMIGFLIEEQLRPLLPDREVATLLTPVVVDAGDPAFSAPSKPVGPVYDEATAGRLASERGWIVGADGDHFRRLVASPEPLRIVSLGAIRLLAGLGAVVICAGGGGVPVVEAPDRSLRGVEAVIDKDLSAALLAREVNADALLMLTDVDGVYEGWGGPAPKLIRRASPTALRGMIFERGSMAPKVEAACRFVEGGRGFAAIGALGDASRIWAGTAGTRVDAGVRGVEYA